MSRLRPHAPDPAESPEALLISAMLEVGTFDPDRYEIYDSDIEAWPQLWSTCRDYAAHSEGQAPPISLIKARFPDFELVPDINLDYAVSAVIRASEERDLRVRTAEASTALRDGDLDGAFAFFTDIPPRRSAAKPPSSVFDPEEVSKRHTMHRIPLPWPTLQASVGGFGEAELWYIAARSRHGKTWQLLNMAASAVASGHTVAFISLEMPKSQIAMRALTVMSQGDTAALKLIRSPEKDDWADGVAMIKERMSGSMHVYDHSHGDIATTGFVRSVASRYDLVIIDHVGLMTSGGSRAIDDWRIQASISNELRAISLARSARILAAAQINRDGERGSASRPPPASKIWGSDAILQDGDVVITMRRWSRRVLVHSAEKVRDGEEIGRYHTWLDPRRGRFGSMTYEQALTQHDADGGDYQDED